jgi:hypothetical protein
MCAHFICKVVIEKTIPIPWIPLEYQEYLGGAKNQGIGIEI